MSSTDEAREAWIAAATGTGPPASQLRADLDALRAELVTLAAAPAARKTDGARGGRPSSRRPQRSSPLASAATVEDTLARADSMRAALDDPRRAWWGNEGARLARAIEAARWDADVARRGRAAAGPPPWGPEAEDERRAEVPEPEDEHERVRTGGRELATLRRAAGMSQADIAERIARDADIAPASMRVAVARFEAGRGGLSRAALDAAVQVCRAVGSSSVRRPA